MYLIDSDYLIYFLKGDEKIVKVLRILKKEKLCTSVICVAEVTEGLLLNNKKTALKQFREFLKSLVVLPVDGRVAEIFAKTRKDLRRQGKLIDNFDLLIASTCLAYNLELITGNKNHFRRIKNLKIYS